MNLLKSILNNIKTQPDIWFFFGFLLTFSLTVRKVLFYFPIKGTFNEYTGIYVYLSDIFLISSIICWFILLYYKIIVLSSFVNLYHLSFKTFREKVSFLLSNSLVSFPLIMVLYSFFSIFWSVNYSIALFRSVKLLEMYMLYLFVIFRLIPYIRDSFSIASSKKQKMFHVEHFESNSDQQDILSLKWKIFAGLILFIGIAQSLIAIIQFIIQQSIGLSTLRESALSTTIPGVAKIISNNHVFIRGYGLFPHPNILAGFLLCSIILTLILLLYRIKPVFNKKLFHVEQNLVHYLNFGYYFPIKNVPRGTFLLFLALITQLIGLITTFSKSAIVALIIVLVCLIVPRGTICYRLVHSSGPKYKHEGDSNNVHRVAILVVFIAILITTHLSVVHLSQNIDQSIAERMTYMYMARDIIADHALSGSGMGQFISAIPDKWFKTIGIWQFQPVHNIFLLIWSELGIGGFALFVMFLYKVIRISIVNKSSGIGIYLKALLWGILFIMFWDHYFWTIQQGQLIFWLVMGIIVAVNTADPNNTGMDYLHNVP